MALSGVALSAFIDRDRRRDGATNKPGVSGATL